MASTLILPDVHNHVDAAEDIIALFQPDYVVFLGDYFDSFGDSPAQARQTALWLKKSLHQPNRTHLWGNHDLPYAFPKNAAAYCPGFHPAKLQETERVLTHEDWTKLRVTHFLRPNLCCSHAGLWPDYFYHPLQGLTALYVEHTCQAALENLRSLRPSILTEESGPLWLRWWNLPLDDQVSQIVGHTADADLRIKQLSFQPGDPCNICLDTMGKYVGWFEDGHLSVRCTDSGKTAWEEE
jgi:hypothetical protein